MRQLLQNLQWFEWNAEGEFILMNSSPKSAIARSSAVWLSAVLCE